MVGNPVVIDIPICGTLGGTIFVPTTDVGLRIGNTGQSCDAPPILGSSRSHLIQHAPVVLVQSGNIASNIPEHIHVCFFGGLRPHFMGEKRLRHRHGRILMTTNSDPLEWWQRTFGGTHAFHDVAHNIVLLWSKRRIFELRIEIRLDLGSGPRFVIVVHKVDLFRATVGRSVVPVVNNIIAHVEASGVTASLIDAARQAPVSTSTMGQQIVVKTANVAPIEAAKLWRAWEPYFS